MKQLIGIDIGGYTFDASAKTVTINGVDLIALEQILMIVNVTQNVIIYNPIVAATGNAKFDGRTLTLEYDTTSHADDDALQIFVDLPAQAPADMMEQIAFLVDLQKTTNELLLKLLLFYRDSRPDILLEV